jgi:hypothetical protein
LLIVGLRGYAALCCSDVIVVFARFVISALVCATREISIKGDEARDTILGRVRLAAIFSIGNIGLLDRPAGHAGLPHEAKVRMGRMEVVSFFERTTNISQAAWNFMKSCSASWAVRTDGIQIVARDLPKRRDRIDPVGVVQRDGKPPPLPSDTEPHAAGRAAEAASLPTDRAPGHPGAPRRAG